MSGIGQLLPKKAVRGMLMMEGLEHPRDSTPSEARWMDADCLLALSDNASRRPLSTRSGLQS